MKEFAKKLKWERERHSWSQEQVAEMIGTTTPNVSRRERSITFPGPYFRQKLCEQRHEEQAHTNDPVKLSRWLVCAMIEDSNHMQRD